MEEGYKDIRRSEQPVRRRRGIRNAVRKNMARNGTGRICVSAGSLKDFECERISREIEVMLLRGNWEGARNVLARAESDCVKQQAVTRDTPLTLTELAEKHNVRTLNTLEKIGLNTVGEVLDCNRTILLSVRQLGQARVEQLIRLAERWAASIQSQPSDSDDS